MFKPLVYMENMPEDIYGVDKNIYLESHQDVVNFYKQEYGFDNTACSIDVFKFRAINSKGKINPYKPWVSHAIFDHINST